MTTLIAAFDRINECQLAREALLARGIAPERIHIQSQVTAGTGGTQQDDHEGFLASVGQFFGRMFGQESPSGDSGRYSEAVSRGSAVLVVEADSDEQAHELGEMLEANGAYDI